MLGQLDTFIAFGAVMLSVSLIITALNQAVASLLGLRGIDLQWALTRLFEGLHPELKQAVPPTVGAELAESVLSHELLRDSDFERHKWLTGRWGRASSLRYEELLRVLDLIADDTKQPAEAVRDGARALVADAKLTPEWFHTVMDRSTQRFVNQMRVITLVCTVLVAFTLHLDTFEVFKTFRTNPELRARVVAYADTLENQAAALLEAGEAGDQLNATAERIREGLEATGFQLIPTPYSSHYVAEGCWLPVINDFVGCPDYAPWIQFRHFFGILLSCILLSLGAPFWYNQLRLISSLRPVVAHKEQREREQTARDDSVTFVEK